MSSRRKRKSKSDLSKSGLKEHFSSDKEYESEGFDFVALVAGMVTSLLVILLIWSYFTSSGEKAKALENVGAEQAGKVVGNLDNVTFEQLISSKDPEDLMLVLNGLLANKEIDPQKQFDNYQRQIDTANKMLVLPLNGNQKRTAVIAKLEAMTNAYELDFLQKLEQPNLVENLRNETSHYDKDPDDAISSAAHLGQFRLEAYELTKVVDFQPKTIDVAAQAIDLLDRYPNNDKVYDSIQSMLDYYIFRDNKQTGIDFVNDIQESKEQLTNDRAREFAGGLSDFLILADSGFQKLFENRLIQGPTGQKQLLETSCELAASGQGGNLLLERLDDAAQWFEEAGKVEQAGLIYQRMSEGEASRSDSEAAAYARRLLNDANKRSQLVGGKLTIAGQTPAGSSITNDAFQGKVVLVFYWSTSSNSSIEELRRLHEETEDWSFDSVEVIAVCVDEEPAGVESIASELDRFKFVIADATTKQNPMLEQCPSRIVPRAMLVQSDGTIYAISVPLLNVKTQTEQLANSN